MTKFYIVYNWHDCYNIYSTRERADLACKKMKERYLKDYPDSPFKDKLNEYKLNEYFYVYEVEEGEAFGAEVCIEEIRKNKQDMILD